MSRGQDTKKPHSSERTSGYTNVACKVAYYLEPKQLRRMRGGERDRVSKAGLAPLNKELYGHIYSCRKTLRRLLTFAHEHCLCASSFAVFLLSLLPLARSFSPLNSSPATFPLLLHTVSLLRFSLVPCLFRSSSQSSSRTRSHTRALYTYTHTLTRRNLPRRPPPCSGFFFSFS